MKFEVKGTELNSVLGTVIKGFSNKEDNSYISFKLDEENNKLILTARSRAAFFRGSVNVYAVDVSKDEPRSYHLDGVKLKQLTTILPKAPVNISFAISDKTRSFTIKTATSKYKLPVLSETPIASAPEVDEYATVDANEFMEGIKKLVKIVSTDPSAQEHQASCMYLGIKDEKLKLEATDAYTLGSINIDSDKLELEDDKDVLVRHTEVNTLTESFPNGETLTIVGSDSMFGYVDENGTLSLVGVINMVPLDTSQIENATEDVNVFSVDKGEIKDAIETVSKLSPSDQTVDFDLTREDGLVRVSNKYGDYIDVSTEKTNFGHPGIASFSTEVLLKGLNPANSGTVRFELGSLEPGARNANRIVSTNADSSDDKTISLVVTGMAG